MIRSSGGYIWLDDLNNGFCSLRQGLLCLG